MIISLNKFFFENKITTFNIFLFRFIPITEKYTSTQIIIRGEAKRDDVVSKAKNTHQKIHFYYKCFAQMYEVAERYGNGRISIVKE